jgi:DNA-directed RNA polymerase subunit alpha
MKIEDLSLSTRTVNTLIAAGVKTLGGLVRKSLSDVKDIEGMGDKGLTEIKELVANYGLTLKEE